MAASSGEIGVVDIAQAWPDWSRQAGVSGVVAATVDTDDWRAAVDARLADRRPCRIVSSYEHRVVEAWAGSPPGVAGLYVKRYRLTGPVGVLSWWLGVHAAQRSWRFARAFAACGIPTPEAVGLLEVRTTGRVPELWLLTREVLETEPLSAWFRREIVDVPESARSDGWHRAKARVLAALAQLVAALHHAGVYHSDFGGRNLLVHSATGRLYLVDLDAVRTFGAISHRRIVKNLDEIGRQCLNLSAVTVPERIRFVRDYQDARDAMSRVTRDRRSRIRARRALLREIRLRTDRRVRKYGLRFTT